MFCLFSYSCEAAKPIYISPRDLSKYSPLNKSLQHLPTDPRSARAKDKHRKQVTRTQSVPASQRHHRHFPKRTTSTTHLTPDVQHEKGHPMDISSPQHVRVSWLFKGSSGKSLVLPSIGGSSTRHSEVCPCMMLFCVTWLLFWNISSQIHWDSKRKHAALNTL